MFILQLSIADMAVYYLLTYTAKHDADFAVIYNKRAALRHHANAVTARPNIAAYIGKRPEA